MEAIISQLNQYKQKYYTNLLIKGLLVSGALVISTYLLFNTLEYFGRFNSVIRATLFFTFVVLGVLSLVYWVIIPVLQLLKIGKQISNEEAAQQIGRYFPDIDDKLLNTLQLRKLQTNNALLQASIQQRTQSLSLFNFSEAIHYKENRKFFRYFVPPLVILFLLLLFSKEFITASSTRIIYYNETFAEKAPFTFNMKNKNLEAFKNEDFTVILSLEGKAIPEDVYINLGATRYKMKKEEGTFQYTFNKLQKDQKFYFEAAGFFSDSYEIALKERPNLLNFTAILTYPAYLGKTNEAIKNIGNLTVPQGTLIEWQFKTVQTDSLTLTFEEQKKIVQAEKKNDKLFTHTKKLMRSLSYQIKLKNEFSDNKEAINYFINVTPDQFPKINMETFQDTALYNYIMVGGNIADDYGLTQLKFYYRIVSGKKRSKYRALPIGINRQQTVQNFFYQLDINNLSLKPGDRIEYFTQVWDNDGVNGNKSSKSPTYRFKIPTKNELKDEIDATVAKTENQMDQTIRKAQQLKKELENFENKIKTKKNLDYNDKKQLEEILKKKKEIEKEIEELKELNDISNQKQERFSKQNEEVQEKIEQLQKLMDNLLDEETKKLYEELEKLLEKNKDDRSVLDLLDKIQKDEENFENDLERALEMFKQLQVEQKMEEVNDALKELSEKQEKLSEETEKAPKNDEQKNKELKSKQEKLSEEFEDLKEEMQQLEEMNESLEFPNDLDNTEEEQEEISQEQENSEQKLDKKQNKKAADSQKKAAEKMKQMQQKMQESMEAMEMEQMQENLDDLRDILENLLTLSFDQEKLMKDFRGVNLSDPRFIELGQKQLKLQDDAKIVEDSLLALSKRVFQIESFVTRELSDMKSYMQKSSEAIKERKLSKVTSQQQFSMTSMNNLALLLSDILEQMQNQMQSMQGGGKSKKKQQGNLSELQKSLNQQIQELKKGGKTGRELSEQLAKMAAQQEMIRKMLEEMGKKGELGKDGGGDKVREMLKDMEKTETDLVNKRLTDKLIKRQKEIETRLLEAEKSMRERDQDEKRKGETAKKKEKRVPKKLEQYIKNREKQVELLKTVPPSLSPYYKKEVDKYFEKIEK